MHSHDRNHRIDAFLLERGQQLIRHVAFLQHAVFIFAPHVKWIDAAGHAQQAASGGIEVVDQCRTQWQQPTLVVLIRVQDSAEPVADADKLHPSLVAASTAP